MIEIKLLTSNGELWEAAVEYAENCSWGAGHNLAKMMRNNKFLEWERVIAAVDGNSIAGFCALVKRDWIKDVDYSPYISFVFVGEPYRGNRISEKLCQSAIEYAESIGFNNVYLVSGEVGLYEKYGFVKIDEVEPSESWGTKNMQSIYVCRM